MLASDEFHDVDTIAEQSKNVRSKGIREYVSKPFTENSVTRERRERTRGRLLQTNLQVVMTTRRDER